MWIIQSNKSIASKTLCCLLISKFKFLINLHCTGVEAGVSAAHKIKLKLPAWLDMSRGEKICSFFFTCNLLNVPFENLL